MIYFNLDVALPLFPARRGDLGGRAGGEEPACGGPRSGRRGPGRLDQPSIAAASHDQAGERSGLRWMDLFVYLPLLVVLSLCVRYSSMSWRATVRLD